MTFEAFPKIPRLRRECTITEKIDGTNAQVYIFDAHGVELEFGTDTQVEIDSQPYFVRAGSRTRWLQMGGTGDNFGFGHWVNQHAHELAKLGPGRHFGEWYGAGIQRRYGIEHKRFALFNVDRWGAHNPNTPMCCDVVPVLYRGPFGDDPVHAALGHLRLNGSYAAPGFMQPEGIVVYMHASRTMHKVTLEKDSEPKGVSA